MISNDAVAVVDGCEVTFLAGPYVSNRAPTEAAIEFARALVRRTAEWRQRAAIELLELYNDDWREPEEPVVVEAEFCALLGTAAIVVGDALECASVYFDAPSLFGGHAVEVTIAGASIDGVSLVG